MTDTNRKQLGETPDAVHVWICQVKGSKKETTVFCSRDRARRWVRARLGSDGEWQTHDWRDRYDIEDSPDTGIVEFSVIEDAAALLVQE
jgi:hypothetical protein